MTDYEHGVEQASDIFPERSTDDQYELRELIKDAPRFEHMERTELVAHAYGLFAAGNKVGAENEKLRELVLEVFACARRGAYCEKCKENNDGYACVYIMRELGIEVD